MSKISYLNPAGNITAIVRDPVDSETRIVLSRKILAEKKAEQVGFETSPVLGGDCRLEMMGGEFCGNATRAFGFLKASEHYSSGIHTLFVEISGAAAPVRVDVNLDAQTAFAEMPLPLGMDAIILNGMTHPVIHMEGMDHLILRDIPPSQEVAMQAFALLDQWQTEACGVMFLEQNRLTPVVYVRTTDSRIWESSCGSGTTACAWYTAHELTCDTNIVEEVLVHSYDEPGGTIEMQITIENNKIVRCMMGGKIGRVDV